MYIIIAGGGLVGGELAKNLMENKHDVVVIDQSKEACDKLFSETGVVAICGGASRIEILNEARIEKADVVIAATVNDADNLACVVLAKSFGVPQIIVRMRNPAYEKAYQEAGAHDIVRVTHMMVEQIMMEIEKPEVRKVTTIARSRADIFAVIVPPKAKIIGMSIKEIAECEEFPSQCVFIAVFNTEKNDFTVPRGQQIITEGDELFFISVAENLKQAGGFLTAKKAT